MPHLTGEGQSEPSRITALVRIWLARSRSLDPAIRQPLSSTARGSAGLRVRSHEQELSLGSWQRRQPRATSGLRFHNIPYVNLFPGILTDAGRPRKSGTIALPGDPTPSPGVMGNSATREVCSPESRLAEVRPAQVCSAQVCSHPLLRRAGTPGETYHPAVLAAAKLLT